MLLLAFPMVNLVMALCIVEMYLFYILDSKFYLYIFTSSLNVIVKPIKSLLFLLLTISTDFSERAR